MSPPDIALIVLALPPALLAVLQLRDRRRERRRRRLGIEGSVRFRLKSR